MADSAIAVKPDIVVISGGENDGNKSVKAKSVQVAATKLFTQLRTSLPNAKIVVLSPLWRATPMPTSLQAIAAEVKQAAAATGVAYVDVGNPLEGQPSMFSVDGTNPNAAGYKKLATTITKAVRKAVS